MFSGVGGKALLCAVLYLVVGTRIHKDLVVYLGRDSL